MHRCNPDAATFPGNLELQPVCNDNQQSYVLVCNILKAAARAEVICKKTKQGLKARAREAGGGGGGRRRLPLPSSAVELLLMRILLRRPNRGGHWFYWKHDTTMTLNDGNGIKEPVGTTGSEKIVIIIIE